MSNASRPLCRLKARIPLGGFPIKLGMTGEVRSLLPFSRSQVLLGNAYTEALLRKADAFDRNTTSSVSYLAKHADAEIPTSAGMTALAGRATNNTFFGCSIVWAKPDCCTSFHSVRNDVFYCVIARRLRRRGNLLLAMFL